MIVMKLLAIDHVQRAMPAGAEDRPRHFRPALKAHPGLRADSLDELAGACRAAGYEPEFDSAIPDVARLYIADPFGNRLEFLQPVGAATDRA